MEYARERVRDRRYAFPAFIENQAGHQIAAMTTRVPNLLDPNPFLIAAVPALPDLTRPTRSTCDPRDRRRGCGGL